MDKFVMEGRVRDASEEGTRSTRKLRTNGLMPVNIYGAKKPNLTVAVDSEQFFKALEDHHKLFQIDLDGSSETGLLKEVQYDIYGDTTIHADLARVDVEDVVDTTMSVVTSGVAKGSSAGATLDIAYRHVPVRGKIKNLSRTLTLPVDKLAANEAIRAKDIDLPQGVEILLSPGTPVIILHGRRGG